MEIEVFGVTVAERLFVSLFKDSTANSGNKQTKSLFPSFLRCIANVCSIAFNMSSLNV